MGFIKKDTLERRTQETERALFYEIGGKSLFDLRLEERTEQAISSVTREFEEISFEKLESLKQTINDSLKFNGGVNWIPLQGLDVVRTPEDFLQVMKLRHEVYGSLPGYSQEFVAPIPGLLYDGFDTNSVIFTYKKDEHIVGSIRVVFDSEEGLPSEEKFSFDYLRERNLGIAEFSRQVIHPQYQSKGGFREFYAGAYNLALMNGINLFLAGIDREHLKLYEKFGGIKVEKEMQGYGHIQKPFLITSWDIFEASDFFAKAILREGRRLH